MVLPSAVLDLTNWYLTLPTGSQGSPTMVQQPALATYSNPLWFRTSSDGGVVFAAPVNGVTTSGSHYPRSELREMTGSAHASWSAATGAHTLTVVEAFTHLPVGKPHLVGAQVHDAKNDWSVFRLEGSNLYITSGNDPHHKLVTSAYVLGTQYEAKFVVYQNKINAYYNGVLQASMDATGLVGAYFKAGAYTQANCGNSAPCDATNYGETTIFSVSVVHSDVPAPVTPPIPVPVPIPPVDPPPVVVPPVVPVPVPDPVPTPVPPPPPPPVPAPQPSWWAAFIAWLKKTLFGTN